MLGYIIKLVFLVIVTMVGLNIFVPERANEIVATFSEFTEIEEVMLKEKLDAITNFTQDTFVEVKEQINKLLSKN
jgi:hypothetical protein